ncbi:hypothetical protein EVA_14117 [gut metagenome]|uniref:Uncharacterized protein n=1 Tax=gut metagenome TaxID=749906 RepID=J9GEI8_9ZZZZ
MPLKSTVSTARKVLKRSRGIRIVWQMTSGALASRLRTALPPRWAMKRMTFAVARAVSSIR